MGRRCANAGVPKLNASGAFCKRSQDYLYFCRGKPGRKRKGADTTYLIWAEYLRGPADASLCAQGPDSNAGTGHERRYPRKFNESKIRRGQPVKFFPDPFIRQ